MKKCKNCNTKIDGEMILYPDLCLDCVIDIETKKDKNK